MPSWPAASATGGDLGRRCRDLRGHGFNCVRHICQSSSVRSVVLATPVMADSKSIDACTHSSKPSFISLSAAEIPAAARTLDTASTACVARLPKDSALSAVSPRLAAGLCKGRAKLAAKLQLQAQIASHILSAMPISPPHFHLRFCFRFSISSAISALEAFTHCENSPRRRDNQKSTGVLFVRAMARHCLRSHTPPSPTITPCAIKNLLRCSADG